MAMMTEDELADKLMARAATDRRRRVRKRTTRERCLRVAKRALENPQADPDDIADLAAYDERAPKHRKKSFESREKGDDGYGFAWLALLLPLLQMLLPLLANWASEILNGDG